uniref:Uncharacterized protein n=1 Tax=Rhizophora mucronata TaxID=61149 RepID=A0A2P2NZK5_RHIMU
MILRFFTEWVFAYGTNVFLKQKTCSQLLFPRLFGFSQ